MKKETIIIFLMFLSITMFAQQYIIFEDMGSLYIVDYDSSKEKYFQVFEYKEKIKLSEIYGYSFVGYAWSSDSLLIYLRNKGNITVHKYNLNTLKPFMFHNEGFSVENVKAYYCGRNYNIIYTVDSIKIVINNLENNIKCYNNDSLLWQKKCHSWTGSIGVFGLGFLMPILSPDKKTILLQKNRLRFLFIYIPKLIEIDIATGKETVISNRNRGTAYSYSPNGRYILFRKGLKKTFCIYDKKTKKQTMHYEWKNAYWLYK